MLSIKFLKQKYYFPNVDSYFNKEQISDIRGLAMVCRISDKIHNIGYVDNLHGTQCWQKTRFIWFKPECCCCFYIISYYTYMNIQILITKHIVGIASFENNLH